jgi:hypothetical protein
MVGVAQRVQHTGHRVVRLPVIMHDSAGDVGEQAAALVDGWPDPRLAGARRLTVCGDVGLIEVRYVRGCLKSMA